jgi:hypothetical protein
MIKKNKKFIIFSNLKKKKNHELDYYTTTVPILEGTSGCFPDPCFNMGSCIASSHGDFEQCICPNNYYGTYCETYIEPSKMRTSFDPNKLLIF